MPKPLPASFATAYAAVGNDLMKRIGDAQAALAGPPIADDIEVATDEKRVQAWNARRPEATDEAMMQLAQQKYAEHRAAGFDDEKAQKATAEDLTHFRYGQRLKLYTYGQIDFKDQVAEAKRLKRLAERDSTPDPPIPTPTMPSATLTNAAVPSDSRGMAPPSAAPVIPPPPPSPSPEPASMPSSEPAPLQGGLTNVYE